MQFCKPHSTETVDNWLNRVGCHIEDCAWLWRPLCAATLNTTSDKASATLFWHVIQDGLMAGPAAATMLIPKIDLGQLLPKAANDFLLTQGCTVQTRTPVDFISAIDHPQYRWQINGQTFSDVIIATAPHDVQRLLAPFSSHVSHACKTSLESLVALDYEPITTVHLHTGLNALPTAVNILPDAPAPSDDKDANLLQIKNAVLIDRAYLDADQKGWHTVVISSSHACIGQTGQALTASVLKHLADCLPEYDWPTSCDAVIIHAKQATYSCVAGITLPPHNTGLDGVYLAGDYVAHTRSYPATLESAVRSGLKAAQLILNRYG